MKTPHTTSLVRNIFTVLFVFILKICISQSVVNNVFTYGNGINQQLPLFKCESTLGLNVSWSDANSNDTLSLYFPNSFEALILPSGFIVTDSTNGFIEVQIPISGPTGNLSLDFRFTNCLSSLAQSNSPLNTNNLQFGSYISSIALQTYTYNGAPFSSSVGNPSYVTFTSSSPAFIITPTTNGQSFLGDANEIYTRRFNVQVNTPVIDSFLIEINQELDVEHFQLRLIDNNSFDGISSNLILNNDTGTSFIQSYIDLQSVSNYFITNNTTRTLTFEQVGRLKCFEPNVSTLVRIVRECCPYDFNYSANLNGRIDFGQTFVNSFALIQKADTTIENGCSGDYYYDLRFNKTGPVALIENISIPLNGEFITSIDSVLIVTIDNEVHAIDNNNYTINGDTLNNLLLNINLFNQYDSLSNWFGFQNYAIMDTVNQDTSYTPTLGPWLDTTSFTIRIRFQYDCTQQQQCESTEFSLVGRGVFHEDFQLPHNPNTTVQLTDSTFSADYLLSIEWWNSCEVDTISRFIHLTEPQPNFAPYVDGFVEMDHEMPEHDAVVYTFYPNGTNPFNLTGTNSALSCDTSVSYRAKFYIPLPEDADTSVNRVQFSINDILVDNNSIPIDSSVFVNDSLLFIPLGQNINLTEPIYFSFDYVLTDCPFPDPPNSGGIQLMLEIQAYCDHCEDCYKTIACNALNVVVHCAGDCDGQVPMGTKSVEMERSTFGFAQESDFPLSPFTDRHEFLAHIDSNSINVGLSQDQLEIIHRNELSKLYPFDLVKLHSEGTITSYSNLTSSIGEPFEFNKIAFELAHTPIGNQGLFALKQASLTFVDSTNLGSMFTVSPLIIQNINPQNTEVFGMSGDTLYSFEIAIPNISEYPQLSDTNFAYTLHLDAEFWTLPDAASPINPIVVRGQFICSTNVDSLITTYSCDPWGTLLRVLIPSTEITLETEPDSISHCASNSKINVTVGGGLGDFVDDFQYEFRPIIAYGDNAFSENFLSAYSTHNLTDTIFYADSSGYFWNPNALFLRPIEKLDSQQVYLSGRKFCASGSDTIPFSIPMYDFAYLTYQHQLDSIFSPQYLLGLPPAIQLADFAFYNSVNSIDTSQADIQAIDTLYWNYSSTSIYDSLFIQPINSNTVLGIAEPNQLKYDLHLKAPDSLQMGNCWLSYKFRRDTIGAPSIPVSTAPFLDSLNYLADTLALDTLGEKFHFFDDGFPLDSLSTTLIMPIECSTTNYRLDLRYGCFCDTASYLHFKAKPDTIPSCVGDTTIIRFQRNSPLLNLDSQINVNNDSLGCALTWHLEIANPINRPSLSHGNLLINIPSGLVLDTENSVFSYFAQGDSVLSASGNYLYDSIPPNYTFQFVDFPTPPTTVLVLAFPSVDTLRAGSLLTFDLQFKLDQSTCNLDSAIFQSSFLQRILEARYTAYPLCNDSTLYTSEDVQQTFIDNELDPPLQSQISSMTESTECCLPSAVTTSINHPCSDSTQGSLDFNLSLGENLVQLYEINGNQYNSIVDTLISDTLFSVNLLPGLYSATVTTNSGLIYVFNSLIIENHGIEPHILLTQNSFCGGSTITLHAVDSNFVNNLGFNASNPFIATDTLISPALNFQWLNSDVSVDSLDNSIANASPFSDTTYQVVISHLSGCIDTASINVNVSEIQTIQIELSQDSLCSSVLYPISVSPSGGLLTINGVTNTDFILDPLAYSSGQLNIQYEIAGDSGCISKDSITVISSDSLCNCISCENPSLTQMVIPDTINLSSQLIGILGSVQIANYCFELNHNFKIDTYIHFIGCEFTIAGGKEIKILSGARFESCMLKGCQQMWAGINNYGRLYIDYTTIKDAHFGILMQRNDISYTKLSNTTFENNFVGIKTSDEIGEHPLTMKSCEFKGGNLLDVFPGQNPLPQDYSLAGIVALNKYELNVAPGNRFTQLCNGVILNKQSSAYFLMVLFDNIDKHGTNYSGQNYWLDPYTSSAALYTVNGNAIFANSNSRVYFEGFGGLSNSNVCFLNCLKGINVNQSDLEVRNTRFEGMTMGINAINERNKRVKILKNRITSRQFGVKLAQCDYMLPDTIGFNTINSIPVGTTSPLTINNGIRVENQYSAFGLQIIGNNITAPQGIFLNTVSGSIVKSDTLSLIPMFLGVGNGIYVSNTKKYELSCNQVQGNSTTIQTGISLSKSPFGLIKNNNVDNTNRGFFVADNCQTDSFKLNTIHSHQIGLDISTTGILGNQINAGNRWSGNYSTTGARRQSTSSQVSALSSFTVHDETNPILYPLNPPFQPFVSICEGFFPCNHSFPAPDSPFCNIVNAPAGISQPDPNDEEQRYLAYLLATDSLNFSEFDEPVKYALRKDILTQLSSNQLTLPDTGVFIQFVNNLAQNPENDFVKIDKMLALIKLSDSTQFVRQSYINQLNLNLKAIHMLDSIMVVDSLFDDVTLIAQKNEIKAIISSIYLQLDLIKNIAQENQYTTRDSSFQYNQGIVTQRDFEEYERRINDIYLNTVAIDSLVFSDQQVAEIEEIARLCPSLGGEAVYRARSLYAIISDTAFYNDELTCLQQGVLFRLSGDKESKNNFIKDFKVIPNPNNGQFTLKAELEESQLLQIRVVSSLGQVLYNKQLNFTTEYNFDCLLNKSQGLYFIQVLDKAGEIIFSEKIIKN